MEKKREFITNFCYYAIIALIVVLLSKYVLPVTFPFIIAFVISFALIKPINRFCKKEGANKKVVSIIVLILFYIFLGALFTLICVYGYAFIQNFINYFASYVINRFEPWADSLYEWILEVNKNLTPELRSSIYEIFNVAAGGVKNGLVSFSNMIIKATSNFISKVPSFFVSFVLMIISSFFIIIDYEKIIGYGTSIIQKAGYGSLFDELCSFMKNKVFVIIKSYAKIMLLTFIELSIGLSVLGIDNALLIAALIAVFDILPVFGTGGVMIPWVIICCLLNRISLALGLFTLYIVITVVRNIVEPKLVGAELGLHPVATLIAMIVGVNLFGVWGLFGLPIALSFIRGRNECSEKIQKEK